MTVSPLSTFDPAERAERQRREEAASPPPPATTNRTNEAIERLPDPHLTLDFAIFADALTPIDPHAQKDLEAQERMDQARDAASGPYHVPGQSAPVSAPPMFRMMTHEVSRETIKERDAIGRAAGLSDDELKHITYGQGTKEAVVKLTQALIDAGKLPPGPGDLASRIKTMQWNYAVGFDCAGYSKEAMTSAKGSKIPFHGAGSESFLDVDTRKSFQRVPLATARPGDLITLRPPPGERWGHNVVVYENHVLGDRERAQYAARSAEAKQFFSSTGPFRALQVDSSWGAGDLGDVRGGYRRDTWIYDESTKKWASFTPGTPPQLYVGDKGPSGDVFHGVYRPQ